GRAWSWQLSCVRLRGAPRQGVFAVQCRCCGERGQSLAAGGLPSSVSVCGVALGVAFSLRCRSGAGPFPLPCPTPSPPRTRTNPWDALGRPPAPTLGKAQSGS
ncbi:hypothetical protein H8959_011108, partial [Pygathrix nigripes]